MRHQALEVAEERSRDAERPHRDDRGEQREDHGLLARPHDEPAGGRGEGDAGCRGRATQQPGEDGPARHDATSAPVRVSSTCRSARATSSGRCVTTTTVAPLGEPDEDVVDELRRGGVEVRGRLVDEQHGCGRQRRPGQGDAGALTRRQPEPVVAERRAPAPRAVTPRTPRPRRGAARPRARRRRRRSRAAGRRAASRRGGTDAA